MWVRILIKLRSQGGAIMCMYIYIYKLYTHSPKLEKSRERLSRFVSHFIFFLQPQSIASLSPGKVYTTNYLPKAINSGYILSSDEKDDESIFQS